eukprot:Tamp_40539.p1 GENE.Tamp_40539~~Tamp_40539.p1  ORF type:complete len:112 (+),score=16.64 Tamp_40539:26-361(+)
MCVETREPLVSAEEIDAAAADTVPPWEPPAPHEPAPQAAAAIGAVHEPEPQAAAPAVRGAGGLSIGGVRVCSREFVVKGALMVLATIFVLRPDLRMELVLLLSFLLALVSS